MKKITSYLIYGFKKKDLVSNDWERIKDVLPWGYIHNINNEVVIGPSVSEVSLGEVKERIDVRFDSLTYIRRIFQNFIMKETGVYIPDSLFNVIHMNVEENVNEG